MKNRGFTVLKWNEKWERIKEIRWRAVIENLFWLGGAYLFCYGIWRYSPALSFAVGGILIMLTGFLIGYNEPR